ncbi:unnamed protein product [Soboliphyme baturini]|uniref:CBF domain-containing protein n=1 Tax=Soboliphyme baturini TaxID=241478 RepID=A0A183J3V6_9BILA|nr:unnamed protein product [Soboliphyme baturini]
MSKRRMMYDRRTCMSCYCFSDLRLVMHHIMMASCVLISMFFFIKLDCSVFSHLPAYVVASFIKRFSRLLLFSPVGSLMIILQLIQNWLVRHPNVMPFYAHDPYIFNENNMAESRALESSLWEVKLRIRQRCCSLLFVNCSKSCPLRWIRYHLKRLAYTRLYLNDVWCGLKQYYDIF